jgi:copper resistance protein B
VKLAGVSPEKLVLFGAILMTVMYAVGGQTTRAQTNVEPMPTPPNVGPASQKNADWPPVMDEMMVRHLVFNELEARTAGSENVFRWDGEGWLGTDMNRLWVKSEGTTGADGTSDGDHEVLYDHPVPRMKYFDAQAGVRADVDSRPKRVWAAMGMEGLAPYFFEFQPTFYISDGGHVAGRIEGSWDVDITQRLVVQPQAELNFYNKDDPGRMTGSGLSDIDTGVRLRYEATRKVNPYIGWVYEGKFGNTAAYARRAGEAVDNSSFVLGVRFWY